MKADFDRAVAFVLRQEGGETKDTGGRTKYGISQNAYPDADIANLTAENAKNIYRRDYWGALGLDELPHPVALAMLEAAVNMGQGPAVRCLQHAVNHLLNNKCLKVDGVLGPITKRAILEVACDPCLAGLVGILVALGRLDIHQRLAANKKYAPHMRGWAARGVRLCEEMARGLAENNKEDQQC